VKWKKSLIPFLVILSTLLFVKTSLARFPRYAVWQITYVFKFPSYTKEVKVIMPFPPELPEQRLLGFKIFPSNLKTRLVFSSDSSPLLQISGRGVQTAKVVFVIKRLLYSPKSERGLPEFKDTPVFLIPNLKEPPLIRKKVYALAKKITTGKKEELAKVKALYDFIIGFMHYAHCPSCGDANLSRILKTRVGNCVDYHSLFVAMAKALRIPAIFEMGFMLPQSQKSGVVKGYHSWVKVLVHSAGWFPLDISEADKHPNLRTFYFGHLQPFRITLIQGNYKLVKPAIWINEKSFSDVKKLYTLYFLRLK